jgi:Zn-dependent metalloprotease
VSSRLAVVRPTEVFALGDEVEPWQNYLDTMVRDGRLHYGRVQADTMIPGRIHERLDQYHLGLPVLGGQIVRQIDGRRVLSFSGRLYTGLSSDANVELTTVAAQTAALRAAGYPARAASEVPLAFLPLGDGTAALVYRVRVNTATDVRVHFIDARTGRVALEYSEVPSFNTGAAARRGAFQQTEVAAGAEGRSQAAVLDFRADPRRLARFFLTGETYPSDAAAEGDASSRAFRGLSDAFHAYLFERFGRRGLDDAGMRATGVMRAVGAAVPHPTLRPRGSSEGSAAYVGSGIILFSDRAGPGVRGALPLDDEVAHQLGHIVLEHSSAPEPATDAGALAESFADILAVGAAAFRLQARTGPDVWVIGEETAGGPGLRSLAVPGATGHAAHLAHVGAAPNRAARHEQARALMGHVFYRAVEAARGARAPEGGGPDLDALARMERVFYRAMVFLLGPHSGFSEARRATLQAAGELYGWGSGEATAVASAWSAVGVQ